MAGESLRHICAESNMPDKSTVFRWLAANEAFRDQYARARTVQAEVMADDILAIADDGTNDWMERIGQDGEPIGWTLNGEHVQRSKLRLDSRKWLMSKLAPKKYGERLELDATINKPEDEASDDELRALLVRLKAEQAPKVET